MPYENHAKIWLIDFWCVWYEACVIYSDAENAEMEGNYWKTFIAKAKFAFCDILSSFKWIEGKFWQDIVFKISREGVTFSEFYNNSMLTYPNDYEFIAILWPKHKKCSVICKTMFSLKSYSNPSNQGSSRSIYHIQKVHKLSTKKSSVSRDKVLIWNKDWCDTSNIALPKYFIS